MRLFLRMGLSREFASQQQARLQPTGWEVFLELAHHTVKLICACIGLVKKCLIDLWKFAIWISINNFVDTFKTVRLLSLQVQSEKHLLQTSSLCRVQGPQEEHLELFLGKQKRKQMDYTNVIMANALNLKLGVRIIRFKNTFLSRWRLFDHRRETMVVLTRLVQTEVIIHKGTPSCSGLQLVSHTELYF